MTRAIGVTLPEELSPRLKLACIEAGLSVYGAPWDEFNATLYGEFGKASLFVWNQAEAPLVEWTVMQALADLEAPGFSWVAVEPFGRFPWEDATTRLGGWS